MSWRITPTYDGLVSDADATAYLAAVQAADGQLLEPAVRIAVNNFIVGCKADGIWTAIKASCILAGARTLAGALVPLTGAAPANIGPFVSGDYNRKIGLVGNGTTKHLDSNRAANSDPRDNMHIAVAFYVANPPASTRLIGAYSGAGTADDFLGNNVAINNLRCRSAAPASTITLGLGLYGVSRTASNSFSIRVGGTNAAGATTTSTIPGSRTYFVFAQNDNGTAFERTSTRLAFYSIGESLDLALLDARVSALITAFGVAIP
jgi:hypothetical protein